MKLVPYEKKKTLYGVIGWGIELQSN